MKPNIVLVSNSMTVLNYEMGKFIDSFDDVVRFNWFNLIPIEQHVKCTGKKTTIHFVHNGMWIFSKRKPYLQKTINDPTIRVICREPAATNSSPHYGLWVKDIPPSGLMEIVPFDFIREHVKKKYGIKCPTTGFVAVIYLLQEYDTVAVAGWYREDTHKSKDKFQQEYCYRNPPKRYKMWHDIDKEYIAYRQLVDEGKVIPIEDEYVHLFYRYDFT